MNKFKTLLPLLLICVTANSFAQPIKSEDEVAGTWFLAYTKKTEQDTKPKEMGITWVLKDHKLIQKDIPQARGDSYDSAPTEILVDNGNLKVGVLGRPGKFDEYTLIEKTDSSMVLKDIKYGALYYFTKK
jgi:hypothetical protein